MKCPSCGFEQEDGKAECYKCAVIFAKWLEKHQPSAAGNSVGSKTEKSVKASPAVTFWLLSAVVIILVIIVSSANRKTEDKNLFKTIVQEKGFVSNSAVPDKIALISNGEEVDLNKYLIPGKIVIFDFYADWCGPCIAIAPKLEALAEANKDVLIRKINIQTWQSKVAVQYGLHSIPNLRVYNKKGKPVGVPTPSFGVIKKYVEESS